MKPYFLITVLLAAIFCVSGHFLMAAYTDYSICQSRLNLLRSQERSIKYQMIEYEKKIRQLEPLKTFIRLVNQMGLKKDQWDLFSVDLKNQPVSFRQLQTILAQTQNSSEYVFKPSTLSIKTGGLETDTALLENNQNDTAAHQPIQPVTKKQGTSFQADAIISLDGRFLVKRRGAG